jgi:hypothetical protein
MFPVFGLLSAVATALGLGSLCWYHSLSKDERAKADRLGAEYAKKLFNRTLNQLTHDQFDRVMAFVKKHFSN